MLCSPISPDVTSPTNCKHQQAHNCYELKHKGPDKVTEWTYSTGAATTLANTALKNIHGNSEGSKGRLTLAATCNDSKIAPHVSPRRKERNRGSKKGVGSSCGAAHHLLELCCAIKTMLLLQSSACTHLDRFPLSFSIFTACTLLVRLCYISDYPARSPLKSLPRSSPPCQRSGASRPAEVSYLNIGLRCAATARRRSLHADSHCIQAAEARHTMSEKKHRDSPDGGEKYGC